MAKAMPSCSDSKKIRRFVLSLNAFSDLFFKLGGKPIVRQFFENKVLSLCVGMSRQRVESRGYAGVGEGLDPRVGCFEKVPERIVRCESVVLMIALSKSELVNGHDLSSDCVEIDVEILRSLSSRFFCDLSLCVVAREDRVPILKAINRRLAWVSSPESI